MRHVDTRISALVCGALLAAGPAHAEIDSSQLWLNAGFYSAHFDRDKGLRNANPGLGFEYPLNGNWSATAGRFINSDNRHSSYLGAYYQPWHLGRWKFGGVVGVFNGYPKAFDGGWFPAVLPVATWEGERIGANIAFVPPLENRLYGALSVQFKFRFGP